MLALHVRGLGTLVDDLQGLGQDAVLAVDDGDADDGGVVLQLDLLGQHAAHGIHGPLVTAGHCQAVDVHMAAVGPHPQGWVVAAACATNTSLDKKHTIIFRL